MTKVISVVNFKGGVGKTTTALNFGFDLNYNHEKSVLLMDLDPQSNLTQSFDLDLDDIGYSITDALKIPEVRVEDTIIQTETIHLSPAQINLAVLQKELQGASLGELRLKQNLEKLVDSGFYDYIIIDTPPTLGMLLDNALLASDGYIIPIEMGVYALKGLSELVGYIDSLKSFNDKLKCFGFLPTFVDNTNISRDILEDLREQFKGEVYNTFIKKRVKIKEAPDAKEPIHTYDEPSAIDYVNFTKEFLRWRGGNGPHSSKEDSSRHSSYDSCSSNKNQDKGRS